MQAHVLRSDKIGVLNCAGPCADRDSCGTSQSLHSFPLIANGENTAAVNRERILRKAVETYSEAFELSTSYSHDSKLGKRSRYLKIKRVLRNVHGNSLMGGSLEIRLVRTSAVQMEMLTVY